MTASIRHDIGHSGQGASDLDAILLQNSSQLPLSKRNLLVRQMRIDNASHTATAVSKHSKAFHRVSSRQTTMAKQARPRLPIQAPRASRAVAFRPRSLSVIPERCFFSVSCFSTRVALAGKMAGNARNRPPKTGPYRLARSPAAAVIAPPNRKRSAYSYHRVRFTADMSMSILIRLL